MKPLKFFCSECNERLTMKFVENDKDEERIWLEPCQSCLKVAREGATETMASFVNSLGV